MAATNPQQTGETNRIDPETGYVIVDGDRVAEVATMSFETEYNYSEEDTLEGNTSHFDGRVKPSGSFEVAPNDSAIAALEMLQFNRGIFDVVGVFPENDARNTIRAIDCKIDTRSDGDIASGESYLVTFDFSGNFVEQG